MAGEKNPLTQAIREKFSDEKRLIYRYPVADISSINAIIQFLVYLLEANGKKPRLEGNGSKGQLTIRLTEKEKTFIGCEPVGRSLFEKPSFYFYSEKYSNPLELVHYLDDLLKEVDPKNRKPLKLPANANPLFRNLSMQAELCATIKKMTFSLAEHRFQLHFPQKCTALVKPLVTAARAQKDLSCIPTLNPHAPHRDTIGKLLSNNRGVVLGYMHSDNDTLTTLAKNMNYFKNQGVTTLFLEIAIPCQAAFQQFNKDGDIKALTSNLQRLGATKIDAHSQTGHYEALLETLTKAAYHAGVQIVAVDYPYTNMSTEFDFHERMEYSDMFMAHNITQHIKKPEGKGKFIYPCGMAHGEVANLLGVPLMVSLPESALPEYNLKTTGLKQTIVIDLTNDLTVTIYPEILVCSIPKEKSQSKTADLPKPPIDVQPRTMLADISWEDLGTPTCTFL